MLRARYFFSFISSYNLGFSTKNIIKNKLRSRLKSETVDKLMRVALNSEHTDINEIVEFFTATKQDTFKKYVHGKMQYHKERQELRSIFHLNYQEFDFIFRISK